MLVWGWACLSAVAAETVVFQEDFSSPPAAGWSWLREDRAAWRLGESGLEVRVQPGNLWGKANNARNVMVRSLPDPGKDTLELAVTVENRPTGQYEQINLAWYYDDRHMVKLGLELVNGKRCIVMGREFADSTRTLGLIPITAERVRLRLRVTGTHIRGEYLRAGETVWQRAGEGEVPAPPQGQAQVSLHCYQGLPDVEHWARFSQFRVARITP